MDTKQKMLWGFAIVGILVVASLLGVLIFGDQDVVYVNTNSWNSQAILGEPLIAQSLSYNNTNLTDHRYIISDGFCEAFNAGMNISIYPCATYVFNARNITQYVNFKWQGAAPQNVSWIFAYEGQIEEGRMLLGHDVVENVTTPSTHEVYVNNYIIDNVAASHNLGTPDPELCELGTYNNTMMYEVNQSDPVQSRIICFSQVTPINATRYSISGNATLNYTLGVLVNKTIYDTVVPVVPLGDILNNNLSYYSVSDTTFQPNQMYKTKWEYTPEGEAPSGKWHIFGYNADISVEQAIDLNQYIYVDPSWDTTTIKTVGTGFALGTSDSGDAQGRSGGIIVVGAEDITLTNVTRYHGVTANNFTLYSSGNAFIAQATFSGEVATLATPVVLSAGTEYRLSVASGGSSYTRHYADLTGNFPIVTDDFNWTSGYYNGGTTTTFLSIGNITYQIGVGGGITLNSPENNFATATPTVVFNATLDHPPAELANATLVINDVFNSTVELSGVLNESIFSVTFADGYYNWSVYGCDVAADCAYSVENRTFNVDTQSPVLILQENITDLFVESTAFPVNVTINYTVEDANPVSCFVFSSDDATNQTFSCNQLKNISFNSGGVKTVFYGANDTLGQISNANTSVDIGTFAQAVDLNPIGEGGTAVFNLTLSKTGIGLETVDADLNYNAVVYPYSTLTIPSSNEVYITRTLQIPDGIGNSTGANILWNWSFTTSETGNFTTSTQTQSVYSVEIDDCSVFGEVILNMTLREEDTRAVINASAGSSIEIDLEISNPNDPSQSWQFSNTWTDEANALVCVPDGLLDNTEYQIDFIAEYVATDRVTEFYYLDNGTLDSTQVLDSLTNKTISFYDLALDESTTFLFEFLDQDSIEVPDAIVHVFRQYIGEGIFEEVERGKQDDNGETHIHLVEEDVVYFFKVSLEGELLFTSSTYNAKCLSSPCAITLTASTETPQFDTGNWQLFGDGGGYVFFNDGTTRTVYINFTTPDPATVNLTVAKQDYTGQLTAIGSQTALSTGGTLSVVVPQSAGNVTYYAIVYKDAEFISYDLVDFSTPASAYYGTTGTVMGSLLLVALILMGAAEGILLFVFIIIAFILVGALTLLELGYYALVGFICAVAILIWKLIKRGRRFEGI